MREIDNLYNSIVNLFITICEITGIDRIINFLNDLLNKFIGNDEDE